MIGIKMYWKLAKLGIVVLFLVVLVLGIFLATLDLNKYKPQIEQKIAKLTSEKVVFEGDINLDWVGFAPALSFDRIIYGDPVRVTGETVSIAVNELFGATEKYRTTGQVDLNIAAETLTMDAIRLNRLHLPLSIGKAVKTRSPFTAKIAGADLYGEFTIENDDLNMKMDVKNLDISQYVSGFEFKVDGKTDLQAVLGQQFVNTLKGEIILRNAGGTLKGNTVNVWGGDIFKNLIPGGKGETKLICIVAPFILKDGIADTKGIVINTKDVVITGKGNINLVHQTVDFQFIPKPKDPSLLSFSTPVDVKGPLEKPAVGLNKMGLATKLGGLIVTTINPATALLMFSSLGVSDKDQDCLKSVTDEE